MLSKEMYVFLKKVPRHPKTILHEKLISNNNSPEYSLFCEAKNQCGYIQDVIEPVEGKYYSLTEKGQAAIEAYELAERNQAVVEKSLNVSKVAMVAAIASAFAAIFSLIKMLC